MNTITIIVVIAFLAVGITLFRFFYKLFEKIHTVYDKRYQEGFCQKCINETLQESCEDVSMNYFIGTTLACVGERCDVCNSYIAEHRKVIFGIIIKKYYKYRVITVGKKITLSPMYKEREFISRRLKKGID